MVRIGLLVVAVIGAVPALIAQAPPQPNELTILRPDRRSQLELTEVQGRAMLSLADVGERFGLTVREDPVAEGVTVSYKNRTIVLAPDQTLVSVDGRVVSLSAAATRRGDTWLVPLDFLNRALAPIYDVPIDLRPASGLVLVGDVRVPRVTVRQETGPGVSKLVLDVAPRAEPSVTVDGRQLTVAFDAAVIDATVGEITRDGYVQAVRVAEPASLQVELGRSYRTYRASRTADADALRITIDLEPAGSSTAAPDPAGAPTPIPGRPTPDTADPGRADRGTDDPAGPPPLQLTAPPDIRTIVLDPGHGGDDTGTKGPTGLLEKDVTLAVARRLQTRIENELGLRVLLTRGDDRAMSLDERAAFANTNKADLFLSLHANAAARRALSGAEVFYLGLDAYGPEVQSARLQAADTVPALDGGTRTIAIVPWDLAQVGHIDGSAQLARLVASSLEQRVSMSARAAIQRAPLRVLVGANMPAVLVELGFLTNAEEEGRLRSDELQTALAGGLYDAIVRFRAAVGRAAEAGDAESTERPRVAGGSR